MKIPQISWNTIDYPRSFDKENWDDCLLRDVDTGSYFYFFHSYYVKVDQPEYCIAETNYGGISYASVVQKNNIMGCQFHPERSGKFGLKLLQNFLEL
ncbi:glutamine amidotransferase-related protein [Nitrospina watsonii]|uniref:glutamine amidotransferase-related protein n=1 Tax=Nitrospina watsonii TaxID=1323948 RepID=UPI0035301400